MKIISFGCKPDDKEYLRQILPALLNKTKMQTIRPAFCKDCGTESHWVNKKRGIGTRQLHLPRFKVGDQVKLLWKCRSTYKWFFKNNGKGIHLSNYSHYIRMGAVFNKFLGTAKITEVFQIEMWIGNDAPLITGYNLRDTYELAKLDGFKPDNKYVAFYNFFSKYNLHEPKKFWVYQFGWSGK